MSYDAGSARATYFLDVEQPRRAAKELLGIFGQIGAAGARIGQGSGVGGAAIAQQRLATETQRTAIASNQAATAGQRLATEQQRTAAAASNAAAAQSRAEQAALRLARAQDTAGRSTQFGASVAGAFKDQILGVLGPVALVTTGLATAKRTVDSFGAAFNFKVQLDATNESIAAQLAGVRDSSRVFAEARQFADRYKLTQAETSEILQNSVGVLRTSTSSVTELETALLRLGSRDPKKPISEAARALRELNSGDVTTIKELFNVSADDAQRMKREIEGGADAVKVLSAFLDRSGNGMQALETRARGALGAMNELKKAEEDLALEQARFAQGPGMDILRARTNLTRDATRLLSGDLLAVNTILSDLGPITGITGAVATYNEAVIGAGRDALVWAGILNALPPPPPPPPPPPRAADGYDLYTASLFRNREAQEQLNLRIGDGRRESILALQASQAAAIASGTDAAAKELLATKTRLVQVQTQAAADAFLLANPHITESGIRAAVTAGAIDPLTGRLAELTSQIRGAKAELAGFNLGRPETGGDAIGRALGASAKNAAFQAAQDNRALAARRAQILSIGTHAQKLQELNRVYQEQVRLFGPKSAEAIEAETALIRERSATQRVGAATRTGQQLATVEQNSGLQQARIQRENLERLRDQQEEFEVGRTRRQEDFARNRTRLLAQGQIFQANQLAEDFARDQRRAQEDFNRTRGRALRNNQEGIGDVDARTDLRQSQILARAGLGPATGRPALTGAAGGGGLAGSAGAPFIFRIQIAPVSVQIDSTTIVELTWPETEQRVDANLAEELATIGIVLPPGGTQTAVSGQMP